MSTQLDQFTIAYIECALWSSTDDDDNALDDNYSIEDIDKDCLSDMIEDCRIFQERHKADIQYNLTRAGHDFWLTRNGHGAGFWDGDWPEDIGNRLTKHCKEDWGEATLYVDDNGKIQYV